MSSTTRQIPVRTSSIPYVRHIGPPLSPPPATRLPAIPGLQSNLFSPVRDVTPRSIQGRPPLREPQANKSGQSMSQVAQPPRRIRHLRMQPILQHPSEDLSEASSDLDLFGHELMKSLDSQLRLLHAYAADGDAAKSDLDRRYEIVPSAERYDSRQTTITPHEVPSSVVRSNQRHRRRIMARSALYMPASSLNTQDEQRDGCNLPQAAAASRGTTDAGITSLPQCHSSETLTRYYRPWLPNVVDEPSLSHSRAASIKSKKPINNGSKPSRSSAPRRRLSKPRRTKRANEAVKTASSNMNVARKYEISQPILGQFRVESPQAHFSQPINATKMKADSEDIESKQRALPWYIRRKRYLWMLVTAIFVLVAVAGILGGLIWRLSRI